MKLTDNYFNIIKENRLFSGLSEKDLYTALSLLKAEIKDYQKGDFVHNGIEPFQKFGLVLCGICEVCADDIEGNRMIMADVSVGTTFGESISYLSLKDSDVYVLATVNTSVLWLDPSCFFEQSDDKLLFALQRNFTAMLAIRTLNMNTRIQVLSKLKLRDRIMSFLSSVSKNEGKKTFTVPLNREDMATYIGANRTALSRELSALKKEGIIDFYKNTFKIL